MVRSSSVISQYPWIRMLSWLMALILLPVVCLSEINTTSSCSAHCTCQIESDALSSLVVNCTDVTGIPKDIPLQVSELVFIHSTFVEFDLAELSHLDLLKSLVVDHCGIGELSSSLDLSERLPVLEVLDLSHNELKRIPVALPSSIKTLILSHNSIKDIDYQMSLSHLHRLKELFLSHNQLQAVKNTTFHDVDSRTSLTSLEKLTLDSNLLSLIEAGAFQNFKSLLALTLADNRLVSLQGEPLVDLKLLCHLDVSRNQLTQINDGTFQGLAQLKYINVSHNQLTGFPQGLPMLEWFDISYNLIESIAEDLKADVYPIEVLNLAHNPFHCDCHMRWLKELYDRREYLVKHIGIEAREFIPVCASPEELAGEPWDLLGDEVFKCDPVGGRSLTDEDSGTVTMSTRVGVVTDTTVQLIWTSSAPGFSQCNVVIQYYMFGHRSATMKRTEVSAAQRDYVLRHLRPATNYVVCLQAKRTKSGFGSAVAPPPVSLSDCIEVATKDAKPPLLTSRLEVIFYYVLGMLATFIGVFTAIGGFAMLYGLWNSSTHWSARYVVDDTFLDGTTYPTDEPVAKGKKPHRD